MKYDSFWELQRLLSAEFSKYVIANPQIDDQIPDNAQIVFNLEDNSEFNEWAIKIAQTQKEKNQAIIIVKIKGLATIPVSRLINPELVLS